MKAVASYPAAPAAHWAAQYIGLPWVSQSHDCWAFFRNIQAVHFGRDVPVILVDTEDIRACVRAFTGSAERSNWAETEHPHEGDAVLMSQHKQPTHVGVWVDVDGGGVLHCIKDSGVIFSRPHHLFQLGYAMLASYRYKS